MITITRSVRTRPCNSAVVLARRRGTASSTEAMGINATVRLSNRILNRNTSETGVLNTWPTVCV